MPYSSAEDVFADADAKIALAKALAERFELIAGTPPRRTCSRPGNCPPTP